MVINNHIIPSLLSGKRAKENSGMNQEGHIFLKKNATLNVDLLTTKLSKKSIL